MSECVCRGCQEKKECLTPVVRFVMTMVTLQLYKTKCKCFPRPEGFGARQGVGEEDFSETQRIGKKVNINLLSIAFDSVACFLFVIRDSK